MSDPEYFFLFLFLSLAILFLILHHKGIYNSFVHLYLSLAWKANAIFHLSQATATRVVIQTPNDYWICYNACDPVILPITNFSLIFSASGSLELYHVSLCIMSDSLIMRVHFPASG